MDAPGFTSNTPVQHMQIWLRGFSAFFIGGNSEKVTDAAADGCCPTGRPVCWSGGDYRRRWAAAVNNCHPLSTPFPSPCCQLPPCNLPSLGKWRWVLLMSVNPDYQAERHQLCPFSAQNTYSASSSNRAIHADKHMKCMNKPQREMKW